jgi:hypothetical protein
MATGTYYDTNYDNLYNQIPAKQVHASYYGKTFSMLGTCETLTATGLDAGSTFYMFRPPKGSRWNGVCELWTDDLTTSVTCSVGIVGTTAKFMALVSHAAAALTRADVSAIDAVGYEFDGLTDVIVTTAGATCLTAKTVTCMMQVILA